MKLSLLLPLALLGLAPAAAAQVIYATAFDDATGWSFSGSGVAGWAVDATPATVEASMHCPGPGPDSWVSAPNSLNFNDGATIGGAHVSEGWATSPVIDLTGSTAPELHFQAAWCHEFNDCIDLVYDRATVRVTDGVSVDLFCFAMQAGPPGEWKPYAYALDPSWDTVQIRIEFDTVDDLGNDGAGLFIDDLEVVDCAPLPASYCVGAPNSAGSGATMGWTGSVSVTANALRLRTSGCPPNQLSLYLYSASQNMAPNGNGFFCLGSPFYRIYPASSTSMDGNATKLLDLTSPPAPAAQILAGSTWSFVNWYRDPAAGGALYNFSDGLEVTFCE